MSSTKDIYKITLVNWQDHNKDHKRSYKKTMIDNNFCNDAKVRALSMHQRWLFLNIILLCGDLNRGTVELGSKHIREMMECNRNIRQTLDLLQSLQLVTYEIVELPLILRELKEKKVKEINRNSVKGARAPKLVQTSFESKQTADAPAPQDHIGQKLVGVYCQVWKARYKSNPPLRAQDTKSLKQIGETNGFDRTKSLLEAYLLMNENWYLKKRHDLATFSNNLTAVAQFLETGKIITNQDLRSFDRVMSNKSTVEALERGEI